MWLHVDPRSSVPVYLQVVNGVKAAVAKGMLSPGDRLPSVRELATELTINHNTIAKAYQELERERIIEVVRGRGTFITLQPAIPNRDERLAEMRDQMRQLLVEAHHLHLRDEDVLDVFRQVIEAWRLETGGGTDVDSSRDGQSNQTI
ncbi:GntR family transcriptional regulator [Alicyclobacillus sp. ALC3]|uniref:GntR family transcriptional regulator n=1 Tax=Alicyclobacillus sp. ALC3 TaxID=2796143 RepID=UPI002379C9A6|nr:GntR family transcriptional regulator [Alicyclobacillus sp. ALC3]WDL96243.1 GntR family transcriptional regulator [Alicyclobacillus sp. ALC3]